MFYMKLTVSGSCNLMVRELLSCDVYSHRIRLSDYLNFRGRKRLVPMRKVQVTVHMSERIPETQTKTMFQAADATPTTTTTCHTASERTARAAADDWPNSWRPGIG